MHRPKGILTTALVIRLIPPLLFNIKGCGMFQKRYRMARWTGRLFIGLLLTAPWGARAAIEIVPPVKMWCADFETSPFSNCTFPTDLEAAQVSLTNYHLRYPNVSPEVAASYIAGCDGSGHCSCGNSTNPVWDSCLALTYTFVCPTPADSPATPYLRNTFTGMC